jgi:hypothetical protein
MVVKGGVAVLSLEERGRLPMGHVRAIVKHDRMKARQRIVCQNRVGLGLSAVVFETKGSRQCI